MPTKGRPKANARVDREVLAKIRSQIRLTRANANKHTILDDEVSTFVERAIIEKLSKMRRCRGGSALVLIPEDWGEETGGPAVTGPPAGERLVSSVYAGAPADATPVAPPSDQRELFY